MKKFATATITALIILNTSLAQQPTHTQDLGLPKHTTGKIQIVTKKELVRHDLRLPPKPKLLRSNPFRFTTIRLRDADPWALPDDEDLALSRHRAKIVKRPVWDDDTDLSAHAKTRLMIARARAVAKHQEIWAR